MIPDIVIDTNVLVHAGNPAVTYFNDSVSFLNRFRKKTTSLCIDEGFVLDESKNRSLIGKEYLDHLRFGSLGYTVISELAGSLRIKECSRKIVDLKRRKTITQLIRKKRDRTFLKVTCNSDSKVFVSHDYADFSIKKRGLLYREIHIHILSAKTGKNYL